LDAGGPAVRCGGGGGGDFGGGGGVTARLGHVEVAVTGGRMTGIGCVGTRSAASSSTGVCARQAGTCRVGSAGWGRWGVGSDGGTWMRRVGSDGGYKSGSGCRGPVGCRGTRCVGSAAGGASSGSSSAGRRASVPRRGRRTVGSLGPGRSGLRGRNSAGCHAGEDFSSPEFSGSSATLPRFGSDSSGIGWLANLLIPRRLSASCTRVARARGQ